MTQLLDALKTIRIFAKLSQQALEAIAEKASMRRLQAGQLALLEGDLKAPVYFITQGRLRTYLVNPAGRTQIVVHLNAGAGVNLPTAFVQGAGAPASAKAETDVELLAISKQDFRELTTKNSEIALVVLQDLSQKLRHFVELTQDLSLRTVRARLARFLLAQPPHAELIWTREDIAARLGTVREMVSRNLKAMAEEGLIEVSRNSIKVLQYERLQDEADS